jgi:hypothetical protein
VRVSREEFKRHKSAKPEFLEPFYTAWAQYLGTIRQQEGRVSVLQFTQLLIRR